VLSARERMRVTALLRKLMAVFADSRRTVGGGEMHEITFVLSPVVERTASGTRKGRTVSRQRWPPKRRRAGG